MRIVSQARTIGARLCSVSRDSAAVAGSAELAWPLLDESPEDLSMSATVTADRHAAPGASARVMPRGMFVDAAARVITRRGDHRLRWAAIAYEAGDAQAVFASQWFDSIHELIDECYARPHKG